MLLNNLQNAKLIVSWPTWLALVRNAANPKVNRKRNIREVNPFVNVTNESLMSLSQGYWRSIEAHGQAVVALTILAARSRN